MEEKYRGLGSDPFLVTVIMFPEVILSLSSLHPTPSHGLTWAMEVWFLR